MVLSEYDLIVINSSAGKDSLAAIFEVCRIAESQSFDKSKIVVSHQDLGEMEWKGTKELVYRQAKHFGLKVFCSKRRNKKGYEETLLEYVERRKKWPDNVNRYCTSDFKRGPGARVVTALTKNLGECKILYVFGFRKEESPARAKKEEFVLNKLLTTKKRVVYDWLPIHSWSTDQVWETIRKNKLEYHPAYDLNMPRLSCVFCVFSPFDALVIAGSENPKLLDRYVATEEKIGHTFRNGFAIKSVRDAIEDGYKPEKVDSWIM